MRTQQLMPMIPAVEPTPDDRSEEIAIESEIAYRLLELRDATSAARAAEFLSKLYAIYRANPSAFWLLLRLMKGDVAALTESYREIGLERHRSKQAVQQEYEQALAVIMRYWPTAAHAMKTLREISARIPGCP